MAKRCRHTWRMKVNLFLDIDIKLRNRLSKRALRSKLVSVDGAGWDKALTYCSKCGRMYRC